MQISSELFAWSPPTLSVAMRYCATGQARGGHSFESSSKSIIQGYFHTWSYISSTYYTYLIIRIRPWTSPPSPPWHVWCVLRKAEMSYAVLKVREWHVSVLACPARVYWSSRERRRTRSSSRPTHNHQHKAFHTLSRVEVDPLDTAQRERRLLWDREWDQLCD